jgi:hypothetical protein
MVDEGWGRKAVDFCALSEPSNSREYVADHRRLAVDAGDGLLGVACGSGLAIELARLGGAECAGIDVSPRLVAVAQYRNPGCDVRVGDMQRLRVERVAALGEPARHCEVAFRADVAGVRGEPASLPRTRHISNGGCVDTRRLVLLVGPGRKALRCVGRRLGRTSAWRQRYGVERARTSYGRLARKVVKDPNATTPADVQALRDAGMKDGQIFAITAFVALRLAFSTVNDALGAHPDPKLVATLPEVVGQAVPDGRTAAPPALEDRAVTQWLCRPREGGNRLGPWWPPAIMA